MWFFRRILVALRLTYLDRVLYASVGDLLCTLSWLCPVVQRLLFDSLLFHHRRRRVRSSIRSIPSFKWCLVLVVGSHCIASIVLSSLPYPKRHLLQRSSGSVCALLESARDTFVVLVCIRFCICFFRRGHFSMYRRCV